MTSPLGTKARAQSSTWAQCPPTHPYAYSKGNSCCKNGYEKFDPDDIAKCNGEPILMNSTCCKDDAYIKCPVDKCINSKGTFVILFELLSNQKKYFAVVLQKNYVQSNGINNGRC